MGLKMKTAQEKTEEWKAYAVAGIRDPDKMPTLAVGTVVRATRLLDEGVTNIQPGTLGFVFGETNCYGDGAGPIVQWITEGEEPTQQNVAKKVCNIYPDDVEIVRVHDSVVVGHLDRSETDTPGERPRAKPLTPEQKNVFNRLFGQTYVLMSGSFQGEDVAYICERLEDESGGALAPVAMLITEDFVSAFGDKMEDCDGQILKPRE